MAIQFHNAALGTKLRAINLLAVVLVVVLSMIGVGVVLYRNLMDDHEHNLGSLTRVLGENLTSTLVFAEAKAANATLEGLAQDGEIVYAGLYDASGKRFASYARTSESVAVPMRLAPEELHFSHDFFPMVIDHALTLTDPGDSVKLVGTLVLRQSLTSAYRQLGVLLVVVLLTGMVAIVLLTWLIGRLQGQITQPLLALTDTMRQIQQGGDLKRRAQIVVEDEIGELAQGFNHLMEELQRRDDEKNVANLRFESVLKAVPDLMFEVTAGGKYLNVWGARGDLLAAPKSELLKSRVEDVLPLTAAQEVMQAIHEAGEGASGYSFGRQIKLDLPIGEHWFELSVAKSLRLGSPEDSFVVLSRDITERRRAEDEIRQLAFYDVLTQLPNRRLLMDRLQTALAFSARTQRWGAVLFLDMDRFKTINDTLGHDHGDLLLLEVARRIQSCLRDADTVARVGGDEFVVVLDELDPDSDVGARKAAQVAEKIRQRLSQPYQLKEHERYSSPSIGVCMYLGTDVEATDLIKCADVAMYQAKDYGRNLVRFFDLSMQRSIEARAQLDADLRNCVFEQQLRLYFQIQVDCQYRPVGAEALVRWFHPRRGMVAPAHFIGVAEESNLIIEIGNWVLDAACAQLQRWAACPQTQHLTLAVNVSAQQFKQPQFIDLVSYALRRYSVNQKLLKLELTESVILSDVATTVEKMQILKAMGVGLSLDDFGTGYSSLSYLKQLPLDQIKIDQSFVRDLETDPSDAVMVRTIIDLAKNFKLNVIAEGVETLAQLSFLVDNGCPEFQGYYFSKPVPIEAFEQLLGQPVGAVRHAQAESA